MILYCFVHDLLTVMRQPFEVDSAERLRHKFMIQSVKVQPGQNIATIVSVNFENGTFQLLNSFLSS